MYDSFLWRITLHAEKHWREQRGGAKSGKMKLSNAPICFLAIVLEN